jgi:catechol 2,3-dioxygenase-like lactoylglutathione lyase family enzyme
MITGFNHSGFVVKDIDKMVAFYRDLLGLTVLRDVDSKAPPEGDHTGIPGAHRTLVFVGKTDGDHALELVHFIEPASPPGHLDRHQLGAAHVCFNVDDLEELHEELEAQGVRFVTDPIFRVLPGGGRFGICYAQDPEGNYLEFIQPGS